MDLILRRAIGRRSSPKPRAKMAGNFALLFCLLAMTPPARAVDGVIEINQAAALAGGVTEGDAPGFPVTISRTGSYKLTGNLDVRGESEPQDVSAILIEADDVTVDLNGFAILGPTVCTGTPLICAPAGFGNGISGLAELPCLGTTVRNGRVRGMGGHGIYIGPGGSVSGIDARSNGIVGVHVGGSGLVTGCTASQNGAHGIEVEPGSIVTENTVRGNAFDGISAGPGSVVRSNTSSSNLDDGIEAKIGCLLLENTTAANEGYGLDLSSAAYGGNAVGDNTSGTVDGVGVQLGLNACDGTTTCP